MSKFKVGDIVTIVDCKHGHRFRIGDDVKIIDVRPDNYRAQSIRTGEFWSIEDEEVKPKNLPTTIIYHKGRETIAMLKSDNKVIKTAKAICNPKDEFNPDYGEKLAFARLHGLDEHVTDILLNGVKEVIPTQPRIIKQDKYNIGDKVKIIDKWVHGCYQNSDGKMDKWLGKIMTIARADKYLDYRMIEDHDEGLGNGWKWNNQCIEGKVIEESIPYGTPTAEPQFDWDGFKQGKFAVHCDTEEKAKMFLLECEQHGIQWAGGDNPTCKTNFKVYGEFTCYSCIWKNSKLGYSDVDLHKGDRPVIDYVPNFREVKRSANVGEWIKIVDTKLIPLNKRNLANGDIVKVSRPDEFNFRPQYEQRFGCYGYVVLEPITPTTEESKPIDLALVYIDALLDELRKRVK